jgi:hypothetical protein
MLESFNPENEFKLTASHSKATTSMGGDFSDLLK